MVVVVSIAQYCPGDDDVTTTAASPPPAGQSCHGHQILSEARWVPPHQLLHLPQPLLHLLQLHLLRVELRGEDMQSQQQVRKYNQY